MDELRGKNILITGGASGIGAAAARLFSKEGARVWIVDISEERGRQTVSEFGPDHRFDQMDVSLDSGWAALREKIESEWGHLDLAFLNAGIMTRPIGSALFDDPEQWMTHSALQRVIGVNVQGVVFGTMALTPLLQGRPGATILVTSSAVAIEFLPGDPFYTASKYAVVGFVRSMAPNLSAKGIRMVAVCPVGIDTPITPADVRAKKLREGTPAPSADDMARAVLDIYNRAKSGETWIGGLSTLAQKHEFARIDGSYEVPALG